MPLLNPKDDYYYVISELKSLDRSKYIACLFVPRCFHVKIASLLLIDLELKNISELNTEKNIILMKFSWWKNILNSLNTDPTPNVPVLRLLKITITEKDTILNKLLLLVNNYEKLSLCSNKNDIEDSYLKCIVTRNDIIQEVLKLKFVDNKYKKAIHLASVALSQIYVGKIEEGNKSIHKAKLICRRPVKKFLPLFITLSPVKKSNYMIFLRLAKGLARYW